MISGAGENFINILVENCSGPNRPTPGTKNPPTTTMYGKPIWWEQTCQPPPFRSYWKRSHPPAERGGDGHYGKPNMYNKCYKYSIQNWILQNGYLPRKTVLVLLPSAAISKVFYFIVNLKYKKSLYNQ